VSKDNRVVERNPVETFNEDNPNCKTQHPELYIKYLEDVIGVYWKVYTKRDDDLHDAFADGFRQAIDQGEAV